MKRILTALLLLLSATATATAYVNADNAQRSAMQHAAVTVGKPLTIPNNLRLADPEQMYPALRAAATEAHVNVFRTAAGYTRDDRPQSTQYVLLTTETHLFDAFDLKGGRWLTSADANDPKRFLSTIPGEDPDQLGVLRDFGSNDHFDIRDLRMAFDSLPVAGSYIVEASTSSSYERFLELLAQKLTRLAGGAVSFTAADFKGSQGSFQGLATDGAGILEAVQLLIVILTSMLLAYRVLHGAKMAGVMKLHGFGAVRVWYEVAGRLILIVLTASGVVALLATRLVPDSVAGFTASAAISLLRAFVVMLGVSLVTCAYFARTKISDSIKNRKDTRGIFALNTTVRVASSIVLIAVGAGLSLQYSSVSKEMDRLGGWDKTRDYGIFYPASVGNDLVELQTGQSGRTVAEVYDLYPVLNKMGALFIDSRSYEPPSSEHSIDPSVIQSIVVNPNYLSEFPLRDASGQTITIAEEIADWVVLAPAKYRARQTELLEYFQEARTGSGNQEGVSQSEKGFSGREAPDRVSSQKVRIVWLENDQKVFSFNPFVNPDDGNVMIDPVIEVMTSANSLGIDRANMITGDANTALKVRLTEGDTTSTLRALSPTLKRLKLDDNHRHLVTMNDYALGRIQGLQEELRTVGTAAIASFIGLLVLMAQSLAIMFGRYSRRIVVRRLFGLGFRRTYRELLLVCAVVWAVQFLGALVANRTGLLGSSSTPMSSGVASDQVVIAIGSLVILIEFIVAVGVLVFIEKRNVIKVLKGDF